MDKVFKDRGIVIGRTNLGEADRIVTIFTEHYGKVRAIAKGVRKIKSKIAGHIELFCFSDFSFAEGKNFDIITEASVRLCYHNLRQNLEKIKIASEMISSLGKIMEDREENRPVFNLLKESLEFLDNSSLPVSRYPLLISYFRLNLLARLGYHPELANCAASGKKLIRGNNYFSPKLGGILADRGLSPNGDSPPQEDPMVIKITDKAIKLLRLMLSRNLSYLRRIKINKELADETNNIVERFWKFNA